MAEVGRKLRERAAVLTHPVIAVGLGLVALQTAFRAWALYPSWFYTDDYRLLQDASANTLDLDYLARPFDSQFMPWGRLVAWLVADSGELNWTLAATITTVTTLLAGAASLWMLVTLFGPRWGILAPLTILLTSALTAPATMWWAASLNQLPLLLVAPIAVGAWVMHLRSRGLGWLILTMLTVVLGLLAYVKALLLILLLAYLAIAFFGQGRGFDRIRGLVQRYWIAVSTFALVGAGYAWYYLTEVPSAVGDDASAPALDLADVMLGSSLASGAVGGPLTWQLQNPPVATAAPADSFVHVAWVVIAAFITYCWLTRARTGRVWLMLAGYAAALYLLVLFTRATVTGAFIGTELRYLTDIVTVLALTIALATMPLIGATEPTNYRDSPVLTQPIPPRWAVLSTLVVALCGIISTARYVHGWHHHNPGDDYLHNAMHDLDRLPDAALASQTVPEEVIPAFSFPYNSTDRLLPLAAEVEFPDATDSLLVLDDAGRVRKALIQTGVTSEPGPAEGCGWSATSDSVTIPLESSVFEWNWWLRIGYLSSDSSPVTISVPGSQVTTHVQPGVNSLFVKVEGAFDEVTVSGLDKGVTLCVDTIEVGTPVPGAAP